MFTSLLQREFDVRLVAGRRLIPPGTLFELTNEDEAETLRFLEARPIHTVYLAGLIIDNGVASPLNRGVFYGCRDSEGHLEGVALVGHATIVETESQESIQTFARFARSYPRTHLIRGEQEKVKCFWGYYSDGEHQARLICREFLMTRQAIPMNIEAVPGLRRATLADLETITTVNASMSWQANGVNPLERDGDGFRERSARRIRQGRVWVLTENNQLIFKTDVISQTLQAAYVEGVYVGPEHRGRGYGVRCLSQLAEHLLHQVGSVCLTVDEKLAAALTLYKRAGFEIAGRYDTIYLVDK